MNNAAETAFKKKACIFDLDGTLLDTLPDLVLLTNKILAKHGYPTYTKEQIKSFVGNGSHALMRQAVPSTEPEAKVEEALQDWKSSYKNQGINTSEPYPFMVETLTKLKQKGVLLGVLSNKFNEGAIALINEKLPNMFDVVQGESPTCPRKPNPQGLLSMIDQLGVKKEHVVYVGDSGGDMKTSKAAGVHAVGVSWGYQPVETLWENGADEVIADPRDLLEIVESL